MTEKDCVKDLRQKLSDLRVPDRSKLRTKRDMIKAIHQHEAFLPMTENPEALIRQYMNPNAKRSYALVSPRIHNTLIHQNRKTDKFYDLVEDVMEWLEYTKIVRGSKKPKTILLNDPSTNNQLKFRLDIHPTKDVYTLQISEPASQRPRTLEFHRTKDGLLTLLQTIIDIVRGYPSFFFYNIEFVPKASAKTKKIVQDLRF